MNRLYSVSMIVLVLLSRCSVSAGIYSGATDISHVIDPAIAKDDPALVEWANKIDATRTMFGPRGSTTIDSTGGFNSLGDLDESEIAAGVAPGFLSVTFPSGITNGAGHDFVVFENGGAFFSEPFLFAELAFVEVSSNGDDFARFPSITFNEESDLDIGFGRNFAGVDTTKIYNLAGKHADGFGTPFDLDDLSSDPLVAGGLLDLNNIQFVKLVDIPGNGAFVDSQGNPIYDPWLTGGGGGGFDFRLGEQLGVGVLNSVAAVPEPGGMIVLAGFTACAALKRRRRDGC